jgi:hypothetical protein
MSQRLIELALEALELRRAKLDAEIAEIRSQIRGRAAAAETPARAARPGKKRGPQSRAAKKAQSERMKAYWAKRRAEVARKK